MLDQNKLLNPPRRHRSGLWISAAFTAVVAVGCASPPDPPVAELSEAKTLIQQADAASAGQYAPGPLASARAELQRAEDRSEDGKQELARKAAERASADARMAITAAERAKAEKAANDATAAVNALRAETQRNAAP